MRNYGPLPVAGYDYDPEIPGDYEKAADRLAAEGESAKHDQAEA